MGRRGFTLVELLIVIAIIAILSAIAIPRFQFKGLLSEEAALRATLKMHREAIGRFRVDTGLYPNSLNALARTNSPAQGRQDDGTLVAITGWDGPYLTVSDNASATPLTSTRARDPVSGNALTYVTSGVNTGNVRSSEAGRASDGTFYSTW